MVERSSDWKVLSRRSIGVEVFGKYLNFKKTGKNPNYVSLLAVVSNGSFSFILNKITQLFFLSIRI